MSFVIEWAGATWAMLLHAAPWLLFGFTCAGLIHLLLPAETVARHLGRPGWGSVLKASLLGVPLPLCSCSVIPVAASIRRRGASRGATASFLVSTPETGADSIAVSYALLGPFLAIVRPIAAFVTAAVAGGSIAAFEPRATPADPPASPNPAAPAADAGQPACCCCHAPVAAPPSLIRRLADAVRHGLVEMFAALAHWLLLGFILSGLVTALVPAGFIEHVVGRGLGPILLMLVVGLPVYVCATSATPLAAALIAKGLSPGAALVFLLAGPATNTATMVVVARELGRRSLILYIASIAVVAVLLGLVVDALPWAVTTFPVVSHHAHHDHTSWWSWVCAFILVGLMLNGLRVRIGARPAVGNQAGTKTA